MNTNHIAYKFHNVYDSPKTLRSFNIGDLVLFCNESTDKDWKLGTIVSVEGNVNYGIEREGKTIVRHVDQIVKFNELNKTCTNDKIVNDFNIPDAKILCSEPVITELKTNAKTVDTSTNIVKNYSDMVDQTKKCDIDSAEHNKINPSSAESEVSQNVRRYPERIRKQPDRLQYS